MESKGKEGRAMNAIQISFYLRANRIHVFAEALRCIGSPKRICFLISADGQTLLMRTHKNRDFRSHRVPRSVYMGERSLEISSNKLCRILAELHSWNLNYSYRVPGAIRKEQNSILFYLAKAEIIGKESHPFLQAGQSEG